MNIQLIYQYNASAEKIYSYLEKAYGRVKAEDITIGGLPHMVIKIADPEFQGKRNINTYKAINNCLNEEIIAPMLKVNNIGYIGDEEGIIRSYEVVISDLDILSIRVVYHGRGNNKPKYVRQGDNPKVSEIARRVFLIMGLDIAMVRIAYTTRRRLKVISINPSPILRERDLNRVLEKIDEIYMLDKVLPTKEIKLGADPEFIIFNSKTNRLISASRFFPREGMVGCDNIRMQNRQQRPIAEIRPRPSTCPLKLSNNIRQALDTASRMAPYHNVKWLAGSQPGGAYSIGGHIHFSNIKVNAGIIRALDNYLAIPLHLIEEPTSAVRRRKRYGFLGDFRVKDHGGFEYRTPASWLISQQITTAVLCLAKIIISNYHMLSKNFLNSVESQRAFYTGDQDHFRPLFPELWEDIEKTDMYKEYKEELQIIPDMISSHTIWAEKSDFRKAWKLKPTPRRQLKSEIDRSLQRASIVPTVPTPRPPVSTRIRSSNRRNIRTRTSSSVRSESLGSYNRISTNLARGNSSRGRIITSAQVRRAHVVRN